MISFEDFKKLEIRIGKVMEAEKVEGSEKLVRLIFDLGRNTSLQVVAGIAQAFPDASLLIGKQMPLLINLAPRSLKGIMSCGMILAADGQGTPVLLQPEREVQSGSTVK
jgi:methionine--tRNA ligase beta chain